MVNRTHSAVGPGGRAGGGRRAFTLLELLVALALGSMVMLLAASSLRAAVRGVGETRADMDRTTRLDRVRAFFAAQLSWVELTPEGEPALFVGFKDGVEVRALMPLDRPHLREAVAARWRVAPQPCAPEGVVALFYGEGDVRAGGPGRSAWDALEGAGRSAIGAPARGDIDAERARRLLEGMTSIVFSYLTNEAGVGLRWADEWKGPGLPRAMRVTITEANGGTTQWTLPVAVTF